MAGKFIAGVLEGFYGRPWSQSERLSLFAKISQWKLSHYMYAPKDDMKHRNDWRILYTSQELAEFRELIQKAEQDNINFIYSLSPGLDISFSSEEDRKNLFDKFLQMKSVGIRSFAVLFDDIDSYLSEEDAKIYTSSAHAQIEITNELFKKLDEPEILLFCPTEYSSSHSIPNVIESQYLQELGKKLNSKIKIMWTGDRVVSETISVKSIKIVRRVLCRKPVIWDNLHANDYDYRRLNLGPYSGRPLALLLQLDGILSNPNNEIEMNFVPLHTLGMYCNCYDKVIELSQEQNTMDWDASPIEAVNISKLYLKDTAVGSSAHKVAVIDLSGVKSKIAPNSSEKQGVLNDEIFADLYDPSKATISALQAWIEYFYQVTISEQPAHKDERACEKESNVKLSNEMDTGAIPSDEDKAEVMDCDNILKAIPKRFRKYEGKLTLEDLQLLCDLFYLPGKNGSLATELLESGCWLKENVSYLHLLEDSENKRKEWLDKSHHFHLLCERIAQLSVRLLQVPNRDIFRQIHPYFWDCREAIMLFDSFLEWIAQTKQGLPLTGTHLPKDQSCLSSGGLVGDLQRLLPLVKSSEELYSFKSFPLASVDISTIRPYTTTDRKAIYNICLSVGNNGIDTSNKLPNYPDLLADKLVGPYLEFSPDICFAIEDNYGLCGYMLAAVSTKDFFTFLNDTWFALMRKKYPCPSETDNITEHTFEQKVALFFYNQKLDTTCPLLDQYMSHFNIVMLPRIRNKMIIIRMVKCIMSVLKAHGSKGAWIAIDDDQNVREFFLNVGFKKLEETIGGNLFEGKVTLGRFL